jgi:uncharacterized membrane protein
MAFCSKCGMAMNDGAPFCPSCGAAQGAAGGPPPPVAGQPPVGMEQTQMAENIAGLVCYVLGWITGIVFLLIDKRPFVKFHAAQSIVVFGAITVLHFVIDIIFGASLFGGGAMATAGLGVFGLLNAVLDLVALVLWIVLMVKAYQGEKFRVPLAADIADQLFGKN